MQIRVVEPLTTAQEHDLFDQAVVELLKLAQRTPQPLAPALRLSPTPT